MNMERPPAQNEEREKDEQETKLESEGKWFDEMVKGLEDPTLSEAEKDRIARAISRSSQGHASEYYREWKKQEAAKPFWRKVLDRIEENRRVAKTKREYEKQGKEMERRWKKMKEDEKNKV